MRIVTFWWNWLINMDLSKWWWRSGAANVCRCLTAAVKRWSKAAVNTAASAADEDEYNGRVLTRSSLLIQQFIAVVVKRCYYVRRNWKSLFSQILLPALFVCVAMTVALTAPQVRPPTHSLTHSARRVQRGGVRRDNCLSVCVVCSLPILIVSHFMHNLYLWSVTSWR